jgi:hypothetical protein
MQPEAPGIAAMKNLSCGARLNHKSMGILVKIGFSDPAAKSRA